MKHSNKFWTLITVGSTILIGSLLTICIVLVNVAANNSSNFERVIIRSLHAPGNLPEGYVKVMEDEELDRVFFINKDIDGFKKQHYKVRVVGQAEMCSVVLQEENYLLVKPYDRAKIYAGMSGSIVKDDAEKEIGFISELTSEGLLKVISSQ